MEPYEGTAPPEETTEYLYVDETQTAEGTHVEGAVASAPIEGGGEADLLVAEGHWGNGDTTHGGYIEGSVAAVEDVPVGPADVDLAAGSAEATGYLGEDRSEIALGASLVSGSAELGNNEHSLEAGLSVGVGVRGTVHHSDADNDGVNEYGIGFDAGPVSIDAKSEALGHAANAAGGAKDALGGVKDGAAGAIGGLFGR